jgi:hypothetical protein
MNIDARLAAHDWDKDIGRDEIRGRLARLKHRARQELPILDDDDFEAAVEEAADRLAAE